MNVTLTGEAALESERARLVGLCYRLTGSLDAAEDLAQETLYEALRNSHKLRDPKGYSPWLSSIARNVCMRWNRSRGRDISRLVTSDEDRDISSVADDYDLEVELDRNDLVDLLDRALAMLPPESRDVLIERYVRESPHAETAARLGLTEAGVAKRLERGRLRLKRVLSTTLIHDSVSHGLQERLFDDWDETDIWCPVCGKRHFLGKFMPDGQLWLICKPCLRLPVSLYAALNVFRGVRGYEGTHLRAHAEHDRRYGNGIAGLTWSCPRCHSQLPYEVGFDPLDGTHYVYQYCEHCGVGGWQFKTGWQLLATPEGREFYRVHQRVRFVPDRVIEADGVPAIVTGYESATGSARIEGVFVRDTFERIGVHVTPGG